MASRPALPHSGGSEDRNSDLPHAREKALAPRPPHPCSSYSRLGMLTPAYTGAQWAAMAAPMPLSRRTAPPTENETPRRTSRRENGCHRRARSRARRARAAPLLLPLSARKSAPACHRAAASAAVNSRRAEKEALCAEKPTSLARDGTPSRIWRFATSTMFPQTARAKAVNCCERRAGPGPAASSNSATALRLASRRAVFAPAPSARMERGRGRPRPTRAFP